MASASTSSADLLEQAASLQSSPQQAEKIYQEVLSRPTPPNVTPETHAQILREQETALLTLGTLYRDQQNAEGLAQVITLSRAFFMTSTAKAKTAKLIRTLLNYFNSIPDSMPTQIRVLEDNIAWAKTEKRIFLKHSLETRLAGIHLDLQHYRPALNIIESLLTELKRLDDKLILTEVHLLESKVYRGVGNITKAKAALTSSRTSAASIYTPPPLQSALDIQSGILHAEEKDYKTAYSYFFEAFESQASAASFAPAPGKLGADGALPAVTSGEPIDTDGKGALEALKYMLLCKVMLNLPEDVHSLLSIKLALKYAQLRDVESMRAIARAHQDRNLADFEKALRDYKDELSSDPTIRSHLAALYDTLLEQNLLRIVEPYSVVELEYVSETVGQGRQAVEAKLSQMILDKVLHGVLDQGRGCLLVYDATEADTTYTSAIETLQQVGKVVESLYAKSVKIG
ncbi:PCI-domain-containing protein [Mycena indigotica]|uniref:PCI-domain-containing protein n=1 Tax=Mycena indigotica TaxID=2126181 RepID=A0A8H6S155_9AGAR|nr:PCI-domain-containing protein [Mycena indigotica]KAF7290527.1 PCI-domain-containing protein [Mycena indigotica]